MRRPISRVIGGTSHNGLPLGPANAESWLTGGAQTVSQTIELLSSPNSRSAGARLSMWPISPL